MQARRREVPAPGALRGVVARRAPNASTARGDLGRPAAAHRDEHRDEHWDLECLALEIDGGRVEVAAADCARFRDALTGEWIDSAIDFASSERCTVEGATVAVRGRAQLVEQNCRLDRGVDRIDLAEVEVR